MIMKFYFSTSFKRISVGAVIFDKIGTSISAFVPAVIATTTRSSTSAIPFNDRAFHSNSNSHHFSTNPSKMDQSFPTWSFDNPCKSMEWNSLADVPVTINIAGDLDEADLSILGIMSPPPKDEEENEDETTEKEVEPIELVGLVKSIDERLNTGLSQLISENGKTFKNGAKLGSLTPTLRFMDGQKSKRYIILGLGSEKTKDGNTTDWTASGFALGKAIAEKLDSEKKAESVSIVLPNVIGSNATVVQDLISSLYENMYADNRYRTGKNVKKFAEDLKSVKLLIEGLTEDSAVELQKSVEIGKALATGVLMTKDIVNAPHNVLNSESLADTAIRIAAESDGRLQCTILGKEECEKRGMGAYLGVARGSETQPQFIHLTFTPLSGVTKKKIALVGKGLLFDTGGYNIKTQMMEFMKFDCGGAAAVLGAARAIAKIAPEDVEVHFIIAACENMINGKAMVPSDILTASNGKTIEVMNTDAEGRLTLADALVYADKELGCDEIVELSTLTGACMVSLGQKVAGLWTNNDDLAKELNQAAKLTGDAVWRMPMVKEYRESLNSKFADIKNIGNSYGGAITAALFLQEFVSRKKPFAHIDIAGPVWDEKKGASGYGAKLITEWVKMVSSRK